MNREALNKGQDDAEWLKMQIYRRTRLKPSELVCPRERSAMTPCVARDGKLAVAMKYHNHPICVGCEYRICELVNMEQQR